MSRMRLMQADEAGASALECLHCGARQESAPPYDVMYCHCRYPGEAAEGPRTTRSTPRAA